VAGRNVKVKYTFIKRVIAHILVILLIWLMPGRIYCQKVCNNNFSNIAKAYLEHVTKKYKLDTVSTIFITSITESENGEFFYEITFFDTSFLTNLQYNAIYVLGHFKLVIPKHYDSLGRLTNIFKKLPFEDLNKSKTLPKFNYSENFQQWYFLMNKMCEIMQVNGWPPKKEFIQDTKKYKLIFAKKSY
jgi:hypothetical protein